MPETNDEPINKAHAALGSRKIVHVDMDAFYASVEQRDELPQARGSEQGCEDDDSKSG